jgi:hypothetical protein
MLQKSALSAGERRRATARRRRVITYRPVRINIIHFMAIGKAKYRIEEKRQEGKGKEAQSSL